MAKDIEQEFDAIFALGARSGSRIETRSPNAAREETRRTVVPFTVT
jgi:hypothetical protein